MLEARAAFAKKFDELPADAGWPVVKEWRNHVYFARSLADWKGYKRGQLFLSFIFLMVGIVTVTAIITLILGIYWVSLSMLISYFVLLIAALLIQGRPNKKNSREILNYQGEDKKFVRILL